MRHLRLPAALALAALCHFFGVRLVPELSLVVDLFVLVVVVHALSSSSWSSLVAGTVAGLAEDALAGGPYGLFAFADTLVAYTTARLAQRLVIQRASAVLLTVMIATLAQQGIVYGLTRTLMPQRQPPSPLWWVVKALAGGLLAFFFHVGRGAATRTRERLRRERRERLRIE